MWSHGQLVFDHWTVAARTKSPLTYDPLPKRWVDLIKKLTELDRAATLPEDDRPTRASHRYLSRGPPDGA